MAGPSSISGAPLLPTHRREHKNSRYQRTVSRPCVKYLERRLIHAWKRITRSVRRPERASVIPEGFVLMNARRRSMLLV